MDRDGSCAGGHVEYVQARPQFRACEQVARGRLVDQLGDGGVVSGGPGRSVCVLQLGNGTHLVAVAEAADIAPDGVAIYVRALRFPHERLGVRAVKESLYI